MVQVKGVNAPKLELFNADLGSYELSVGKSTFWWCSFCYLKSYFWLTPCVYWFLEKSTKKSLQSKDCQGWTKLLATSQGYSQFSGTYLNELFDKNLREIGKERIHSKWALQLDVNSLVCSCFVSKCEIKLLKTRLYFYVNILGFRTLS